MLFWCLSAEVLADMQYNGMYINKEELNLQLNKDSDLFNLIDSMYDEREEVE